MIKREEINKKLNIFVISYAAFRKRKTGVEEYIYEILSQWKEKAVKQVNITLYVKRAPPPACPLTRNDNFNVRVLKAPFAWTLARMSLELLKIRFQRIFSVYFQRRFSVPNQRKLSVLFSPGHVLPLFCGMPAVVTIHGLEFEHYPEYYPFWHRLYLKWMTKLSCRRAKRIIAVSESTKRDLIRFYGCDANKITVIYHGANQESRITNHESRIKNNKQEITSYLAFRQAGGLRVTDYDYILYLGRIELKKNILNIIRAFDLFKSKVKGQRSNVKLVLAGPPGYGYHQIRITIHESRIKNDIIMTGYVTEKEKWGLLKNAAVFLFPTYYEGFGMPVLEAQSVGTPVITSDTGATKELTRDSALLIKPDKPEKIADAVQKLLTDKKLCENLISAGRKNVKRFSWERCARETLKIIIDI